ncbi:MAG: DNA alkylation repair protein [Actinobacteria bacterium]|nr:DNA alkylation repair protein [Actinomycetota bacterium]
MDGIVSFVADELSARADSDRAVAMAAYMKTEMPFHGVPTPQRRVILREALVRYPIRSQAEYRGAVMALWDLPHREEKYVAVGLAIAERRWITFENLDLYRRLIVDGAWWDFVDSVAANLIGKVLLEEPDRMWPTLDAWIDDQDLWLRRTAILAQLKHKDRTDTDRLFDYCLRRAHEKEFFIRKAIGWALREYAKTDSVSVSRFLLEHREELSGLSFREAAKHLDLG